MKQNKVTLFELTNHLQEIEEYISNLYEMLEEGEISEEELDAIYKNVEEELKWTEEDFDEKICNYGKLIKNLKFKLDLLDAQKKVWNNEIDLLRKKSKVLENNINRLKSIMINSMEIANKNNISGETIKVSLRNVQSVEITDEQKAVEKGFGYIEYKPNKQEIKKIANTIDISSFAKIKNQKTVIIK